MVQKKCGKCGLMKTLDQFHRSSKGLYNLQSYCKACGRTQTREHRNKNRQATNEKARKDAGTPRGRFMSAKRSAKRRGISFDLTEDEFYEFMSEPCFYCDGLISPPSRTGSNIDREDSSKGYFYDNCLPCCSTCNKIKNKFLSLEETLVVIDALLRSRGLRT